AGGMPGVMQPGVLRDACFGQERLPLVPVVVRVDRSAVGSAPHQVPLLPAVPGRLLLGVLALEVLAQRQDELGGEPHAPLPLALGPGDLPPAFPLRARLRMARAAGRAEPRALPAVLVAAGRARPPANVLAARGSLGLRTVGRARVKVQAL